MKAPVISETYHMKPVYSLSWGPMCGNEDNCFEKEKIFIYSCGGDGNILMHDPNVSCRKSKLDNLLCYNNVLFLYLIKDVNKRCCKH